ncbi:DUF11 domain-containing protein [Chryseobacterium sp. 5_R23647]|jgi:uncharacterized repeat protein (TIGR01451 family)|uniref:DUF11 domain-containing protein n=1 Tax=Chryseobacterium sp. 5_R23647 TaxID=2258964 RepID=UPI000E26BCC3|nr:DUF11 domain-containing protein [Chryseobacterium sp. 5_R23647]REC40073.1 hypothetical protein DRF69_20285 [Chryseobacterium sp. 5_R23647]
MKKTKLFFITIILIVVGTNIFHSQQIDRLYLSTATTGRVYDITDLTGTVALPTPLTTPVASPATNLSNLAVGYDSTGGNPSQLVFIHSNTPSGSSVFKNGTAITPAVTLPAGLSNGIGGLGTNNVPGTYFGRVYGFQSNTKTLYPIYPAGASIPIIPATGDTDWASGSTFGTDTFFDYENNIYMFINNAGGTARYLYKIAIASGIATKVVQIADSAATVGAIQGMAYLKGFVYIASLSGNNIEIRRINIFTGASTLTATLTNNASANLDLATVPYYVPFTFTCNGIAFQGNSTFATEFVSTRTLRIPISDVYGPGTYTIRVTGTDFATTNQSVTIAAGTTFIDVPVTYNGTGAAGTRSLTVQLGNSSTICQFNATVEPSFGCNSSMYISQSSTLYSISTATSPFTYPAVGAYTSNFNSIGLNPLDGMIYGTVDNTNTLVRVNSAGVYTLLGAVSGLPTGINFNAGEFDTAGNYYVKQATSNATMYRVNVNTMTATAIAINQAVNISDFAFRPTDNKFYAVAAGTDGRLLSIDLSTSPGTVTLIGNTGGLSPFGAMFGSSTGEIYGSLNSGGFYQFNLSTGQRTLISLSPGSNANDGAHCVTAPITFSTDLYVTKTDATSLYIPGTTTTYTIVAGNNGPFGVQGATVSDPVPAGIPSANVSYTVAVSGNATTSVSGTQTGAINDIVSIPVDGTVTYTVVLTIPISYTGNLSNTVTISVPANITDTNTLNNSATDVNVQSACFNTVTNTTAGIDTKHGITLQTRAGVENGNWPMIRKSAYTALESNNQGFVITRISTANLGNITNPQEGMMVFDTTAKCIKIYSDGAWKCFSTPACP